MDCSTPGLPVHHQLLEFTQTHVHWVGDTSNHLILCCPLLLLPSIFPSIRVFSNETALHIRWPKFWSFSFSFSQLSVSASVFPMNIQDLVSLRMDISYILKIRSEMSSTFFFVDKMCLRPSSRWALIFEAFMEYPLVFLVPWDDINVTYSHYFTSRFYGKINDLLNVTNSVRIRCCSH